MSLVSILEQLREFDTALLANTIGYIDSTPAHEFYMSGSIQSVTPNLGPSVGVAVTCEVDTSSPNAHSDWDLFDRQLELIQQIDEPVMWVVKSVGSRPDHECVLGDGMAKLLHSVGCVGMVTDGGVRDVDALLTIPFSAYSHGRTVHHGNVNFKSFNSPIEIGGITVGSGEVIHANAGGVIKIPRSCLEVLPKQALHMRSFEHEAHSVFRQTDIPIAEKRQTVMELLGKFGFAKRASI